ncbi:MAG: hypothetical protein WAV20_19520 [Blastocatellia bacterium]
MRTLVATMALAIQDAHRLMELAMAEGGGMKWRMSPNLAFSKHVTAQMLAKGTGDRGGMRWIQAEHRVRPELLVAQTGYMQGAAGIGMLLVHLDLFQRGKKGSINFPDSPFD